jgi:transcriptional regulator with XRE-family HTH domain
VYSHTEKENAMSKLSRRSIVAGAADNPNQRFGRRLNAARLALKLSEQEAANAMRITVKTYRKWEAGGLKRGGMAHIVSFCEAYDVSASWLLAGEGSFFISGATTVQP